MNQKLGATARDEIRKAMTGLVGTAAMQQAARQAANHDVTIKYIYKMTKDLRPATRKRRSDAGRREFALVEGTDVFYAAHLVIADKLDPQEALDTARVRGYKLLPSLEYFQKILREHGLGRRQRRAPKRAFRQWEAEFPGEMFQIDVTALKVRWQDEKTRRIQHIEGVDKNHPQMDPTKLRVWQIMLIDDHSRRRFLRYITTTHITSSEMVRFMCEAYGVLGVPKVAYTDNGSEFKGYHTRATRILNSILSADGGYRHQTHMPGNSQASGKVEIAHQWAEKMDRLIGLAVSEGQAVTVDMLNTFADRICDHYNNRIHRATNETPMVRWHGKRIVVRKLPVEIIESALLSDEFEALLDAGMTVARGKAVYRIPDVEEFKRFIGQTVKVVVPKDIALILVTLPDGTEYEIEKVLATADRAGEFKRYSDTVAQDLTKQMRELRKERIRTAKAEHKLTGEIAPVPHLNIDMPIPQTNVSAFPHQERIVSAQEIAAVTPVPAPVTGAQASRLPTRSEANGLSSNVTYTGRDIVYWQAVTEYANRFPGGKDEAKQFLLGIFPNTSTAALPAAQIESAIAASQQEAKPGLRAVG